MLENNRDEINYHKFLKSVRKSQKVSLEKLARGVCTKSGMSRIEAGNRLPDKLVRDRLTARLGISGEEYEEYLLPREYEQWECRMEIISCINKKDISGAEEKIAAYENTYNKNKVEIQFVETMRFMVMEMKECSEEELFAQISKALACTVEDIDAALDGAQLLADQELNLIMEYVRLRKEAIPERNLTEWKLEEYKKIVRYVENSRLDKIAQAKVYSKLACFIAELILEEYENEESLRYALDICTRGVEILRDTVRLYYFVELNEYRMKLIEKLRAHVKTEEEDKYLEELHHTSDEWAALFHELYTENELPVYMENSTHLYTETECNNISDVIRVRRAMTGLPRHKLIGNACTERTLLRIESGKYNPTMAVVRDLFEKLGLCAEYKRARVVTSDAEIMQMSSELICKMNDFGKEEARKLYNDLKTRLEMEIVFNEQEMKRVDMIHTIRQENVSEEALFEILVDIMECTLSMEAVLSNGEKYFSRTELSCLHDFAIKTNGDVAINCREIINRLYLTVSDEEYETGKACVYEFLMLKMASYYGNISEYEKSNYLSDKVLKESLRTKRLDPLMDCTYNRLWNYQSQSLKMSEQQKFVVAKSLKRCFTLSNLARKDRWKNFFQQKYEEFMDE